MRSLAFTLDVKLALVNVNPDDCLAIAEQADLHGTKSGIEELVLPFGQNLAITPRSTCPHGPEKVID